MSTAVIINQQGFVLMMLRDNKPGIMHPGVWGLIGGHIEPGEKPTKAMIREIHEETGLEIIENELHFVCESKEKRENGFIQRFVFILRGNWTDKHITRGEGTDMRFLPPSEIREKRISPPAKKILGQLGILS